ARMDLLLGRSQGVPVERASVRAGAGARRLNRHLMRKLIFLVVAGSLQAQAPFQFTIQNIMRGPELYGREPQNVRWSADGQWIYFNWLEPGADWREAAKPFRVRAVAGATPERLTQAQMDTLGVQIEAGQIASDGRARVASIQGD